MAPGTRGGGVRARAGAASGHEMEHQMFGPITSSIMPRTTLDLDLSVLEQLRRRARVEHKSMGRLASERLAVSLRDEEPVEPMPLSWISRHMGKPRVDLEDKDALWRVLDAGQVEPGSR